MDQDRQRAILREKERQLEERERRVPACLAPLRRGRSRSSFFTPVRRHSDPKPGAPRQLARERELDRERETEREREDRERQRLLDEQRQMERQRERDRDWDAPPRSPSWQEPSGGGEARARSPGLSTAAMEKHRLWMEKCRAIEREAELRRKLEVVTPGAAVHPWPPKH